MTPAEINARLQLVWAAQDRSLWPDTEDAWLLFSLGYIEGIRLGAEVPAEPDAGSPA